MKTVIVGTSRGSRGPRGRGIAAGGAVGEVLAKAASDDYGTEWKAVASKAQGALADTALQPAAIGVTIQAHSANLDEFAAVNPTAAGLALLDDASADAQLATLGGGTSGIAAFKSANAYTLRAITEPSIILSQVDASGFEAKWTAALAVIAAAGGGKIRIDASANVASILTTLSSSHNNLTIEGTHSGVTLTASSPIIRFMTITGSNITFRNIAFAMGGNITSGGIQVQGSGVTFDNITACNTVTTGGIGFLSTFGAGATDLRVMNSYFHTLGGSCITVQSGAARVRVMNNRATNIGQRFYYQTATTADIENVIVTGNRIYDTASSGSLIQAAYTSGGAYRTRFINISGNEIIDEGAATGSGDTILFQGSEHGVIANNVIRRPSDVGISVAYQSLGVNVVGNQISYTDLSGIDFGANATNGGVSNCHAVGNMIYGASLDRNSAHTYYGYLTAYDSDNISFVANRLVSDPSDPGPHEAMFWDCTNINYTGNTCDSSYTGTRFAVQGTCSFRKIDGAYPGTPTMASGAPAGQFIYDTSAPGPKVWTGSAWAST